MDEGDKAVWDLLKPHQQLAAQRVIEATREPQPPIAGAVQGVSSSGKNGVALPVILGVLGGIVIGVVLAAQAISSNSTIKPSAEQTEPIKPPPAAPKPPAPSPTETASDGTTSSTTSDAATQQGGGLDYLTLKTEAEEQLKAKLSDDHGVRYRNVETRLSTMSGGGIVAFCGEENSRSPLDGYGGFQRFIASRSAATTEADMNATDFQTAWDQFCTGGVEGPKVWF